MEQIPGQVWGGRSPKGISKSASKKTHPENGATGGRMARQGESVDEMGAGNMVYGSAAA